MACGQPLITLTLITCLEQGLYINFGAGPQGPSYTISLRKGGGWGSQQKTYEQ